MMESQVMVLLWLGSGADLWFSSVKVVDLGICWLGIGDVVVLMGKLVGFMLKTSPLVGFCCGSGGVKAKDLVDDDDDVWGVEVRKGVWWSWV
jgi:hypothetical protein